MPLKRSLRFVHFLAATMGTPLGSSGFLTMILMAQVAGDGTDLLLAMALSTALVTLAAFAYGELVSIFPTAAGNRAFLRPLIGNRLAITAAIVWVAILFGGAGAEAYIFGNVLNYLFPAIPAFVYIMVGLGLIIILNAVGVEPTARAQIVLTTIVAVSLVAVSVYALAFSDVGSLTFPAPNPGVIVQASAISVYLFLGFGRVTTLGEEAEDYKKSLPSSMPIGVLFLGVIMALVALSFLKVEPLAVLAATSVPQVLLGRYLLGGGLAAAVAVVSLLMSFTAFNAGLLGTSRLVYALGRERILPARLGKVSDRFLTPVVSLVAMYVIVLGISAYVVVSGNYSTPLLLAAAVDSFVYGLVALSAFKHLRKGAEVPFRPHGGRVYFPIIAAVLFVFGALVFLTSAPAVAVTAAVVAVLVYAFVELRLRRLRAKG